MRMIIAACALVVTMAVPVAAQESGASVGASFTLLRDVEQNGVGFAVDVAKNLAPTLAVVGDIGLNKFDGFTITSFQGGVRFLPAVQAAAQPFIQALVGIEHCCGSNAFAFQIGGGVEVPVSDRVDFRVFYGLRRTHYGDGDNYTGHIFGGGIVVPIGGN